jgi:hypothetical protein
MIDRRSRAAARPPLYVTPLYVMALLLIAMLAGAVLGVLPGFLSGVLPVISPAMAQAPSEAQREAIKSQCRSDYIAHCSSIQPGGAASLQCLQKNMANLAPGCQSAVRAVEAPAAEAKSEEKPETRPEAKPETNPAPAAEAKSEPKPEVKPEAKPEPKSEPATATAKPGEPAPKSAPPKPAPSTASMPNQPSSAQIAAIRGACRSDYPKVCAGVPTGGAPALQCLEKNRARLSAPCEKAVAAAAGGAASPAAGAPPQANAATAPATAAPEPTVLVLRPMRPREELFVLRSACGEDVRTLCAGVAPGGGRIMQCLAVRAAAISPACKDVLAPFAAR